MKKTKNKPELYLQLWLEPILQEILHHLTPTDLHTLIGLSTFINKKGKCHPSLNTLRLVLGLSDISSVSRRIKSLQEVKFNNENVLTVKRCRKKNKKGNLIFTNNKYTVNKNVVSIFQPHKTTIVGRQKQMEGILKQKQKLCNDLSFPKKDTTNNITKTNL